MMVQSPSHPKVLKPTEQHYAKNKCELLTCVFGAEHFQTFVSSRHFMIKSDYKSLEQISMKNLADALVHLQRMLTSQSSITEKIRWLLQTPYQDTHLRIHQRFSWTSLSTMPTSMLTRNKTTNLQSKMTHYYLLLQTQS